MRVYGGRAVPAGRPPRAARELRRDPAAARRPTRPSWPSWRSGGRRLGGAELRRCGWCGRRAAASGEPVGFALVTAIPDGLEAGARAPACGWSRCSWRSARSCASTRRGSCRASSRRAMRSTSPPRRRPAGAAPTTRCSCRSRGSCWRGRPRTCGCSRTGALLTPSLDLGILAGVTRETLIDAAAAPGIAGGGGRLPAGAAGRRHGGVHVVQRARGDAGGRSWTASRSATAGPARWRRRMQAALRARGANRLEHRLGHPVPGGHVLALQRVGEPAGPCHLHHVRAPWGRCGGTCPPRRAAGCPCGGCSAGRPRRRCPRRVRPPRESGLT